MPHLPCGNPFRPTLPGLIEKVRNSEGRMVPLGTLVKIRDSYGPNQIARYNMYPSAAITGITLPGTSSAEAIGLMEKITADTSVFPAGGTFGALSPG